MDLALFIKGIVIGFSIAAPVGPIGMLCIRRTLNDGWLNGLASGLGSAMADAVYGAIAAFGLTVISGFLVDQQVWLRLIGGTLLCWMGLRTFRAPSPDLSSTSTADLSHGAAFSSTFLLTLTNPITIIYFAAIFSGIGADSGGASGSVSALVMVSGVFAGSGIWWVILSSVTSAVRGRLSGRAMRWINRGSALVIAGFGAATLLSLLDLHRP